MKLGLSLIFALALPLLSYAQDPIVRSLPPDTVVAIIDGAPITLAEVDTIARSQDARAIFGVNEQLYNMRERILTTMVGERLLANAAKKSALTTEEYVAKLPVSPIDELSVEAMVKGVTSRNPTADPDVLRPLARQHLLDQKRAEARKKHIEQLKLEHKQAGSPIVMNLQPPRIRVPISSTDPTKGAGPIELVEFSDFECPYCQKAQPIIRELMAKYEGKIKLIWKDFPLPLHDHAVAAAVAARCAQEENKFWQYHDVLFANQNAFTSKDLRRHAETVGLDLAKFDNCVASGKYQKAIKADMKDHPVEATPTFLVNGRRVQGASPDLLIAAIERELGN
jgi:protein-disulfide isomerase